MNIRSIHRLHVCISTSTTEYSVRSVVIHNLAVVSALPDALYCFGSYVDWWVFVLSRARTHSPPLNDPKALFLLSPITENYLTSPFRYLPIRSRTGPPSSIHDYHSFKTHDGLPSLANQLT